MVILKWIFRSYLEDTSIVQERDREQSSNANTSFARLRYRDAGNGSGASKQVEDKGGEVSTEPDRGLVGHSNKFLDCTGSNPVKLSVLHFLLNCC